MRGFAWKGTKLNADVLVAPKWILAPIAVVPDQVDQVDRLVAEGGLLHVPEIGQADSENRRSWWLCQKLSWTFCFTRKNQMRKKMTDLNLMFAFWPSREKGPKNVFLELAHLVLHLSWQHTASHFSWTIVVLPTLGQKASWEWLGQIRLI